MSSRGSLTPILPRRSEGDPDVVVEVEAALQGGMHPQDIVRRPGVGEDGDLVRHAARRDIEPRLLTEPRRHLARVAGRQPPQQRPLPTVRGLAKLTI